MTCWLGCQIAGSGVNTFFHSCIFLLILSRLAPFVALIFKYGERELNLKTISEMLLLLEILLEMFASMHFMNEM